MNDEEKLKFIENLLDNNNEFEQFITSIENLECDIPDDLEINIRDKLNIKKVYYFDILKIVACTIFALLFWQFIIINPKVQANTNKIKPDYQKDIQIMQQFNMYLEKIKYLKGDK